MSSDVTLKKPGPGETLATILTFATLVVSAHVHGISGHAHVEFVTMGTSSCFFVRRTAMGLPVTCQVT